MYVRGETGGDERPKSRPGGQGGQRGTVRRYKCWVKGKKQKASFDGRRGVCMSLFLLFACSPLSLFRPIAHEHNRPSRQPRQEAKKASTAHKPCKGGHVMGVGGVAVVMVVVCDCCV